MSKEYCVSHYGRHNSSKPTGKEIEYNKEYHPLATKEWDKAMMRDKGEVFKDAVKDILIQRCKELYG